MEDTQDLIKRIAEYRAGMKPHILAVLTGPLVTFGWSAPQVAEHIMDALTREGFVCAGPVVERAERELRAIERSVHTLSPQEIVNHCRNGLAEPYRDWLGEVPPHVSPYDNKLTIERLSRERDGARAKALEEAAVIAETWPQAGPTWSGAQGADTARRIRALCSSVQPPDEQGRSA